MSQTTQSPAAQAANDSAGISPGLNNGVLPCCEPKRHLQIGIFFDGTGNYLDIDRDQANKVSGWEKKNKERREEAQQQREKTHAAVSEAARRKEEYAAQARQLRAEQAKLEQEAQWSHNRALSYEAAAEGIEELGWQDAEQYYQLRGEALDAWRAAKSRAARKAAEADEAEKQAAEAETEYRRLQQEQRRIEEEVAPASEDKSSPSNVAKLYLLYLEKKSEGLHRIYIKGVGTVTAATKDPTERMLMAIGTGGVGPTPGAESPDDYSGLGLGFGLGPEGGQARILEARGYLLSILRQFKDCPPASVTFDVFGFSRGAALARHFVNLILDGLPDYSKKPQPVTANPPKFGALRYENPTPMPEETATFVYPPLPDVKIRFVGLFDTVGSFYWPGNNDEGEFILHLPEGCADNVLHLVSADERRKNFRYTRIDDAGTEYVMAGVHSDIGGGYSLMEKIFLLMDKESYEDDPYGLSKARAEAALARRAVARSLWTEGMVPAPGFFFKHELQQMIGQGIRQNICYLMRTKVTDGRYATVPLRFMYNKATKSGVPFDISRAKNPEWYEVPADLSGYVDNPPPTLPLPMWDKYLHVSAVDVKPVQPCRLPALGRYSPDMIDQKGMKLDDNPLGARVSFPN